MKTRLLLAMVLAVSLLAGTAGAAAITGNPDADGWNYAGNALSNGLYVKGSANYGYDVYTTSFTVTDSSVFDLSGHGADAYQPYYRDSRDVAANSTWTPWDAQYNNSWKAGDTVIGLGGVFSAITAEDAGWASFAGNAVNSLLSSGKLKLQGKFGTDTTTWSTSTKAPGGGDGNSSGGSGGDGTALVRTSTYVHELSYQNTSTNGWSAYSGQIMGLQEMGHISIYGTYAYVGDIYDAARLIWQYDASTGLASSWQILLNTSMLYGPIVPGNAIISTVQNGSGDYTDALVYSPATVVPEPTTMTLLGLGLSGLALSRIRRRKAA